VLIALNLVDVVGPLMVAVEALHAVRTSDYRFAFRKILKQRMLIFTVVAGENEIPLTGEAVG